MVVVRIVMRWLKWNALWITVLILITHTIVVASFLLFLKIYACRHHDLGVIDSARGVCATLLRDWSVSPLVQTVLQSSTAIVVASLLYVPEQLQVLMDHVRVDARQSVKLTALACLEQLASRAPHAWQLSVVHELYIVLESTAVSVVLVATLRVLAALAQSTRFELVLPSLSSSPHDASLEVLWGPYHVA